MATTKIPICLTSRNRELVDSILADAVRISPEGEHFSPAWADSSSILGDMMFEATTSQITTLLSDIYIFGESTIYEKSLMYEISRQCIRCLDVLAIK